MVENSVGHGPVGCAEQPLVADDVAGLACGHRVGQRIEAASGVAVDFVLGALAHGRAGADEESEATDQCHQPAGTDSPLAGRRAEVGVVKNRRHVMHGGQRARSRVAGLAWRTRGVDY